MKITIVTNIPFPNGMAPANRIISYATGFQQNGIDIEVLCIKATERKNHILNHSKRGLYLNIPFRYITGTTIKSETFIGRRIQNFTGYAKVCAQILFVSDKSKPDAIIYYSELLIIALFLRVITKIRQIIFLKEESEFPFVYTRNRWLFANLRLLFYEKFHYKLFDGLLLMTKKLCSYMKDLGVEEKKIIHVPMTVNIARFENPGSSSIRKPYIAYCGILNDEKDGTNILLEAFNKLTKTYKDLILVLIGVAINNEDIVKYKNFVMNNNLEQNVIFTGKVERDQIPALISNADFLILPRPSSLQAEGGFPTKLGEYLATGRPVIVSDVGEISNYLTDKINAFFIEPGNIDSLFKQMMYIMENKKLAEGLGIAGKEVAKEYFNPYLQTKIISEFLRRKNTS